MTVTSTLQALAVLDLVVDPAAPGLIGQYGLSISVVNSAGSRLTWSAPCGRSSDASAEASDDDDPSDPQPTATATARIAPAALRLLNMGFIGSSFAGRARFYAGGVKAR